jgi:serine/threonine protein kinase
MGQVLSGLVRLHGYDVVHNDLKPANVFYSESENGRTRIGDLGNSFIDRFAETLRGDFSISTRPHDGLVCFSGTQTD